MSLPLQAAFEVSACHGGAVDVFKPFPIPATMPMQAKISQVRTNSLAKGYHDSRPTIMCGTL
jgi:hypothetical protein